MTMIEELGKALGAQVDKHRELDKACIAAKGWEKTEADARMAAAQRSLNGLGDAILGMQAESHTDCAIQLMLAFAQADILRNCECEQDDQTEIGTKIQDAIQSAITCLCSREGIDLREFGGCYYYSPSAYEVEEKAA